MLTFLICAIVIAIWTFTSIYYFVIQLGNKFSSLDTRKPGFVRYIIETILFIPVFILAYIARFIRWVRRYINE
jgi:hypothetical protein